MPTQQVLYVSDLAVILGKSYPAIVAMHHRNQLPRAFYVGGKLAWLRASIDAWIEGIAAEAEKPGPVPAPVKRRGRRRMGLEVNL